MNARRSVWPTVGAVAIGVLFLAPLAIMLLGSLRPPLQAPPQGLDLWPERARWANYESVGAFLEWRTYLLNSAFVVVVAVPATVLIASAAGFLLRAGTRLSRWLIAAACALGLLVPSSALWVPRVVLLREYHLADHQLSIVPVVVASTTPFAVLLFLLAYRRLPREWFDVAATEGAGTLRTWWRVAHPSVRSASFAVALITFVFAWSDYIDPLTLIASPERWPLALGLRSLAETEAALYPIYLAAAVLATVPAVLVFLVANRTLFAVTLGERS